MVKHGGVEGGNMVAVMLGEHDDVRKLMGDLL